MMTGEMMQAAQRLVGEIRQWSTRDIHLMEFCGGHTAAILKHGLRQLLPETVHLFSGPGCPVCVTSAADIDRIILASRNKGVITATFGDLMRVPGTSGSLQQSRAEGSDIRVVYSALEALDLARQNPEKKVVMTGIGFETTAPTLAASLVRAEAENLKNYLVLSCLKLTPPVMKAILDRGETSLNGIICPGHVSAVIGPEPYEFIPREYGIGCAVTGFEPLDILAGAAMLVRQIESGRPRVDNAYRRAVRPGGNPQALEMMARVFDVSAASWRGIGTVPESGLKLKAQYRERDAEKVLDIPQIEAREPAGCLCGEVLRGVKRPAECALFRTACTPEHPVGPCMVSSEGACSAYHLYGEGNG